MFDRFKNAIKYLSEASSVSKELQVLNCQIEEKNKEIATLRALISEQTVKPIREQLETEHDGELPALPMEALSMAETLFLLSCEADEAEARKKSANAKFDIVNENLSKQMISNRLPKFTYHGFDFELDAEFHVNVLKVNKPFVHDWLRNNGHGELLSEDYNASSFKSLIKELREANNDTLPDELNSLITIYEPVIVSMKKAKANSAKAKRVKKVIDKQS